MSAKVRCDHCGWIGSEFDCHACLAPVGSEVAFTALTDGSLYVPLAGRIKALVTRMAERAERGRAMYSGDACLFCGKKHEVTELMFRGVRLISCPNISDHNMMHAVGDPAEFYYQAPDRADELKESLASGATVEVQTSVDDYDGEDDRDTDPPPPMSAVSCYWCGKKATVELYHGIPSCGECHDRALRSKRR